MTVLAPAAIEQTKSAVRIGLVQSALPMPDVRWQGGISYRPLDSNIPAVDSSTFFPCNNAFGIDLDTQSPVSWDAFGIGLAERCLSGSTDEEEERLRAERRLQIQTEHLVSRTFWTGEVASSDWTGVGSTNRALSSLASDELTTTGPVGVVTGFARAVGYLADTIGSERGMIHVDPHLLPFLAFYGVVDAKNFPTLVTSLADHIVVAGSGYDGSAPDGSAAGAGTSWIYATSMVRGTVGPIFVTPPFLNRSNNQMETYASRPALYEWDLQAHAAIQVCIPDPGPSCEFVPS